MIDLSLHQYPYRRETSQERPGPSSETSSPSALPLQEPVNTSFAFLVHSQDTIPNNLPPSVDNKPLARARRRRTSPEDQIILEAEFLRDSKPDRAARARIVERVALGEKEVQIWFQNRRQNSRRKSRPLLPHEVLGHLETSRTSATPNTTSQSPPLSRSDTDLSESALRCSSELRSSMSLGSDADAVVNTQPSIKVEIETSSSPVVQSLEAQARDALDQSNRLSALTGPTIVDMEISTEATQAAPALDANPSKTISQPTVEVVVSQDDGTIGLGISNTNVGAELEPSQEMASQDTNVTSEPTQTLKPKGSRVRLSMTSDGIAKILTGDESSPSPPKYRSPEAPLSGSRGVRRSYSTAGLEDATTPLGPNRQAPGLRRVLSGRSRDSRAWEFWCDSEARNVLAKKADQEQSGSAADAISLMRSTSRSALTPISNKGNIRQFDSNLSKHGKPDYPIKSRPVFGRVQSSVGRLQGAAQAAVARLKGNGYKKSKTIDLSGADSDKENWDPVPGLAGTVARRRLPQDKAAPRPDENTTAPSGRRTLTSDGQRRRKQAKPDKEQENVNLEDDRELADFMHGGDGGGGRSSRGGQGDMAGEDDLDCIQGLLSLSQGNWK